MTVPVSPTRDNTLLNYYYDSIMARRQRKVSSSGTNFAAAGFTSNQATYDGYSGYMRQQHHSNSNNNNNNNNGENKDDNFSKNTNQVR